VTEHAGDLLSALLDGELSTSEAAGVQAHVATCPTCGTELADVRAARQLVRSLPAVDPPFPLELLPRVRSRAVVANVAASIAIGLLLLGVSAGGIGPAALQPEMSGAIERHASTVSALQAGGVMAAAPRIEPTRQVPPTTAPRRDLGGVQAPVELAGYELVDAYRALDGGQHLLYRRGGYGLSVFRHEGRVDWDALATEPGTFFEIGDRRAWRWDAAPSLGRLVVVEERNATITLVGDEPGDAVLDAARALPSDGGASRAERMSRAVARALELLSPVP
jgi:hypothetical protein